MEPIPKNQNQTAQIEQYKTYFKRLNIAQYGAGVLMQALGENDRAGGSDDMFGSSSKTVDESSFVPSAVVNIDKNKVLKKLWQDLESELRAYEKDNPQVKDSYVVALNTDTEDGQPAFRVAGMDEILSGITDKTTAKSAILEHPVQIFQSKNLDVKTLKDAGLRGVSDLVQAFMLKNKGVFQYFNQNTPSEGFSGLAF